MSYREYEKKTPMVETCVTDATPENTKTFTNLIGLYRFGMAGSGIQAFVICELQVNMLWGLSGHKKWEDFCEHVLGVSRRTADRIVNDGRAIRRALKMDEHLKKCLETQDFGQLVQTFSDQKLLESMPQASRAMLGDARIARALKDVPAEQMEAVVAKSKECGKITIKAVRATVRAMRPKRSVSPQSKVVVDKKRAKLCRRILFNLRMARK